uniref:Uncharacterized protein n=1 Tax=Parascaris equorum TaxID=6256 RepID=A0A914R6Z4_PAREQ
MESEENDGRTALFGAIDESIVRMRDQIKLVLGKQRSKEWLRGHKSQQEFDVLGLAMMPSDQKFVHSDFLLTMANTCKYVREKSTTVVPAIPAEHCTMLEGLSEIPPLSGWLPSKGQIKGRMLLAAWEHGIEDVAEDAINPVMAAARSYAIRIRIANTNFARWEVVGYSSLLSMIFLDLSVWLQHVHISGYYHELA